jgi:hypothetical protein
VHIALKDLSEDIEAINPSAVMSVSASLPNLPGVSVLIDPSMTKQNLVPSKTTNDATKNIADDLRQAVSGVNREAGHIKKKGVKYYSNGPELLTSLKGTKLAGIKVREGTAEHHYAPIVLDAKVLEELQAIRKDTIGKIVHKAKVLKS